MRWSGERPVYAGRFNMEKRELLGEGRADLWADGLSAARESRRRSNVGVQCISPNIVGCSQRSRQVVEQKHAKPCLTSPVSVTR